MEFSVDRDALVAAISRVVRVSRERPNHPALGTVRVEVGDDEVRFGATDTELVLEARVATPTKDPGVVLVPADLTARVVRTLPPGPVSVSHTDGQSEVIVRCGPSRLTLCAVAGEMNLPAALSGPVTSVDRPALIAALARVLPAVSTDTARPVLCGVHVTQRDDGVRLAATDSFRLAVVDLPARLELSDQDEVVIPARALAELSRLGSTDSRIEMRMSADTVRFSTDHGSIQSRLVVGEYPQYADLLPSAMPNRLEIAADALSRALTRARALAADAPVVLDLGPEIRVSAVNSAGHGRLDESAVGTYEGAPLQCGFNPAHLAAAIEAMGTDKVVIGLESATRPALITPVGRDDVRYLLMPVRFNR